MIVSQELPRPIFFPPNGNWVYLNLVERQTLRVSEINSESPQTQSQCRSRVAVYAQKPEDTVLFVKSALLAQGHEPDRKADWT